MEAFKVQVIDNGSGMGKEDIEQVGKRYFTSKCSSLEDLENLRFFGFRGEAVASITSLATVVEIASRTKVSAKTFVKIFKDGKGMDVFESGSTRPSAGTTVVICNFFHNMPVRRKRMDAVLECERIRQRVEAISLTHPSISFTLKNDCTGAMVVQLPKVQSTYYRFVQIHGLVRAQKLGEISLSHGQFGMSGYMGREGHYNNSLQFLFVNSRLILKTRIHKLLNFLLKKMSGSSRQSGSPSVSSAIGSPKQRAGTELHAVYIINIKCHYSEYDVCLEPAKTLIEFKDWDGVLSCLEEGVKVFLTRENLVAELSPEDVHDYVHGNDFIEPVASPGHVEGSAAIHALASTISIPGEPYNDMNSNYQQPAMEKHSNTLDSTGPAEFRNASTTAQNMPTPVLSAGDCIGDPLQMVTTTHNPDLCSSEVEKLTENDGPLCSDTTHGERMQSESTAAGSSDWLEHFDDSVGKLVYINKLTGLSKYEASTVEEIQVPCTTDVTTMSVSVISGKGFEYKCYPFQTELVLPYLPRSRAERVLSSGLDKTDGSAAANSLSSMFSEWSNPVFVRPPEVAVDVTSGQADGLAVKIHNILYPYRFTKDMIHSMKVIHQVDKKFLACLINTRDQVDAESSDGNLLVLVDQHAAHERVRLENLVTESYEEDPEAPGQKRLCSSFVTPPLEIEVTEEELRLLRSCQLFLRGLGLEIRFAETGPPRLLVGKVPVCFVEREASELRRGRHTATKAIVEEYIREQIELLRSTGRVRGTLPLTVLKVLASQACHGAIKFNDSLNVEECNSLVGSLSTCQLPFQCAHGRPSMVPLADLLHLDNGHQESTKPNLTKLRRMYRAWELYGKK
ncbi:hypothetical protein AAFF_G00012050 [Aldrovandia affinis]|uniref:DNA mismatch repair protein Mlh3 n=1 Tax=Aldrovandia affinis TaxID=143900 RepID=A0AAD7WH81_9TELE|nr:hypothetical protein AAFF_G00012050 [Aldrovandia affinis]